MDPLNFGNDQFGREVVATPFGWAPDRKLNPQYDGVADEEFCGMTIVHHRPDNGELCSGAVTFDTPAMRAAHDARFHPLWTVEQWDPLTISPSVLCTGCGHHGFIREGKWVGA